MSLFERPPLLPGAAGLAALALLVASCAESRRAVDLPPGPGGPADCDGYAACMERGRQSLREGVPNPAAQAFKNAAAVAVQDLEKQEAYGCLGIAQEVSEDIPRAQAALEAARAVSSRKLDWVEDAHKRLQPNQALATAEYLEKKREANQEIKQLAGGALVPRLEEDNGQAAAEDPASTAQAVLEKCGLKEDKWRGRVFANLTVSYPEAPSHTAADKKISAPPKPRARACRRYISLPSLVAPVYFAFGSAELTPQDQAQADEIAKFLETSLADERRRAALVGHTDQIGGVKENQLLSEQRAEAVKTYLLAKPALKERQDRLSAKGVGESQLSECGMDERSRASNRRVEIRLDSDN